MSKFMLLPAALAGFSCGGQELVATSQEAGRVVSVPDEHVQDALDHGLLDLDAVVAEAEADADRKVREASVAVAAAKAAKNSKAAS